MCYSTQIFIDTLSGFIVFLFSFMLRQTHQVMDWLLLHPKENTRSSSRHTASLRCSDASDGSFLREARTDEIFSTWTHKSIVKREVQTRQDDCTLQCCRLISGYNLKWMQFQQSTIFKIYLPNIIIVNAKDCSFKMRLELWSWIVFIKTVSVVGESVLSQNQDVCESNSCERISTKLLTKHQYHKILTTHRLQTISIRTNFSDLKEPYSWINILRKRKKGRNYLRRSKRSSHRTVMSLDTELKRRKYKRNSKCHKYAMFKVNHWKFYRSILIFVRRDCLSFVSYCQWN